MKNYKKLLALLLALVMTFSLVGCNNKSGNEEKKEDKKEATDTNKEMEKTSDVEITYLFLSSGADKEKVQEKLNEKLAELKAGYKVKLLTYGWDNYAEKLGLAARGAGDSFDLATTASWLGPYGTIVAENGFLDITDMLNEFPTLKGTLQNEQIEGSKIDGKLYAIPSRFAAIMARDHLIWNISGLEAIGKKVEDVENVRTIAELEPFLAEYKAKFPDKYPLEQGSEWAIRRVDSLIRTGEDGKGIVENIFAAPYMKEALNTIKMYREKGYIHPDAGKDLAPKQDEPDTWLVKRAEGEPGSEAIWSLQAKTPVKAVTLAEDKYIGNANITGKLTAVYAHSKHPKEALDFIEKIATDKDIQNLLAWGIEGEHYKIENGVAVGTEKREKGWLPWQAQFVSDKLRIPGEGMKPADDPEFMKEVEKFEAELKPAADLGFTPTLETQEKLGQVLKVKNDFYQDLSHGRDNVYEDFLKQLDAAGINDVVKMLTDEYNAWKK